MERPAGEPLYKGVFPAGEPLFVRVFPAGEPLYVGRDVRESINVGSGVSPAHSQ